MFKIENQGLGRLFEYMKREMEVIHLSTLISMSTNSIKPSMGIPCIYKCMINDEYEPY